MSDNRPSMDDLKRERDGCLTPYATATTPTASVHWAVFGEDGYNVDDLRDTREHLEEIRHPIAF